MNQIGRLGENFKSFINTYICLVCLIILGFQLWDRSTFGRHCSNYLLVRDGSFKFSIERFILCFRTCPLISVRFFLTFFGWLALEMGSTDKACRALCFKRVLQLVLVVFNVLKVSRKVLNQGKRYTSDNCDQKIVLYSLLSEFWYFLGQDFNWHVSRLLVVFFKRDC